MLDLKFFEHLEIFRKKIIWILSIWLILTIISFVFINQLVEILKYPVKQLALEMIYTKPAEKFLIYFKLSFFSGLVLVLPYALFQIGSFIFPALFPKEKRFFILVIVSIFFLFAGGCLLSYFYLAPFVFDFFIHFAEGDGVKAMWSIGEYFHLLIMFCFLVGLTFQLPVVLLTLIKFGILKTETLKKYRKHSIIIIFIIAAVITPPDVYSQIIIGTIMYLLFELTLFFGKKLNKG